MELTSLKVKIGLKDDGTAKYPDFNQLQCVKDSGLDWSKYIDAKGLGWQYDKTSGHKQDTKESPFGQQFGMLLVPEDFGKQALASFSDDCTKLTETEAEDFYDNKAAINMPDEIVSEKVLAGINAKKNAGITLSDTDNKALDATDSTPGIKKNPVKKFTDMKSHRGITIKELE